MHRGSAHNQLTFYKNKLKTNNKNRAAELKVDAIGAIYEFSPKQLVSLRFNI